MSNYAPRQAQLERIEHYHSLIQDFENQIKDFDEKLANPNESEIKKQGWKILKQEAEKGLKNCREYLQKELA